jgi:hyaluronoglucosaminidase
LRRALAAVVAAFNAVFASVAVAFAAACAAVAAAFNAVSAFVAVAFAAVASFAVAFAAVASFAVAFAAVASFAVAFAAVACAAFVGVAFAGCSAPPSVVYPAPRFVASSAASAPVATACVTPDPLQPHALVDGRAADLVSAAGLQLVAPGAACDYAIEFASVAPPLSSAAQTSWDADAALAGAAERYAVVARAGTSGASATLHADSEAGALHALVDALALVDGKRARGATLVDAPSFATRGIVEGYYGAPFSRAQRRCVIAAMERLRLGTYLYGPKNDDYAHASWSAPYPADRAAELADAASAARARAIDFVWAVSPGQLENGDAGGSIAYSSDADFARLTAKIERMRSLGIDRFALFLDDTSPSLPYAADRAAFASPAAAHAALANRLDAYVTGEGAAHLLFVGWAYTSGKSGWEDYARTLGATLAPGIGVLWTGNATYATTMRASDFAAVDTLLNRKVVIWDNAPVKIEAVTGRAADVPDGAAGYLANPVTVQLGASFGDWWRTLGPAADYAWNPAAYDAASSFAIWNSLDACD